MGGLAFCLALLWLGMRAVLDIGGACASGGPYVPRVECPDAVIASTPLSILGLFVFGGLAAWGGSSLGGGWIGLIFLAWPALFISLGWNFLEYGFFPPEGAEGWIWGWIFCGVVFVLMGAVPLVVALWGASEADGGRAYAGRRVVVRRSTPNVLTSPSTEADVQAFGPASDPVADRLERLAALHDQGKLTDEEFEAAKRATLAEGRG
jgi:hypothetical protein